MPRAPPPPPQGRTGGDFQDQNEGLITALCRAHPDLISLEMETFHLLDLARCAKGARGGGGLRGCYCTLRDRGGLWGGEGLLQRDRQ